MSISNLTGTSWLVKASSFTNMTNVTYYINKYNTYYSEGYSTPLFKITFTYNNTTYYGLGTNIYKGSLTSFPKGTLLHNNLELLEYPNPAGLYTSANRSQYSSYSDHSSFNTWPTYPVQYVDEILINITGGEDATNQDLISWLELNAVQQTAPSVTSDIFFGGLDVSEINLGSSEVSAIYLGNAKIYEK